VAGFNDGFGDVSSNSATTMPQMQVFSASAIAARAKGGNVPQCGHHLGLNAACPTNVCSGEAAPQRLKTNVMSSVGGSCIARVF